MAVQATQAAAVSWQSPELRAVWSSGIAPGCRLTQKHEVPPPVPCGGWAGTGEQGAAFFEVASLRFFCDAEKVN